MKGIANHHGPESCLKQQQWGGEALTVVRSQVWDVVLPTDLHGLARIDGWGGVWGVVLRFWAFVVSGYLVVRYKMKSAVPAD